MSLGSPSVPSAPGAPIGNLIDPVTLSGIQQSYNLGSGIANQAGSQYTMSTPGYTQNYTQTGTGPGGVPIYGVDQALTGQANSNYNQYLLNQATAGSIVPQLYEQGQGFLQGASGPLAQASNAGQSASDLFQTAQNPLAYSQDNINTAGSWFNAAADPYGTAANQFGQSSDILSQYGLSPLGTANNIAAKSAPWLRGTGQFTNQYNQQDPSQIGNMSSGLVGDQMQSAVAGIQPFQTNQRNQLDTQLRNQGLHPGMPGYDQAMLGLDNGQNTAIDTFMAQYEPQAWQQATQVYQDPLTKAAASRGALGDVANTSQLYQGLGQQGMAGSQASNAIGTGQLGVGQGYQGIGQGYLGAAQAYTGAANSYAGLGAQEGALMNAQTNLGQTYGNLGLNTASSALPWLAGSAPTLPPTPAQPALSIQPTNIGAIGTSYNQALGTNYQNQLASYNAQLSQNQNMLSGLFGVGSSVLGGLAAGGVLSERRFKENIEPLGTLANGISIYSFNYKWGGPTIIGPMVDEIERIMPQAVFEANGVKLVNYGMVMS